MSMLMEWSGPRALLPICSQPRSRTANRFWWHEQNKSRGNDCRRGSDYPIVSGDFLNRPIGFCHRKGSCPRDQQSGAEPGRFFLDLRIPIPLSVRAYDRGRLVFKERMRNLVRQVAGLTIRMVILVVNDNRRLPVALLVAAHLKPRSECSRRERLDAENIVSSMCLLGCDGLYERGLVAVSEGGRILVSAAHSSPAVKVVLRRFRGRTCDAWNSATAGYFEWHLRGRFQGNHSAS